MNPRHPLQAKPCARPGCHGLVIDAPAAQFRKRKYCTLQCANQVARRDRQKAGRIGGEVRRRKAVRRVAAELDGLIPASARLEEAQRRLVMALVVRAWRRGYDRGRTTQSNRVRRQAMGLVARQEQAS